jgi:hypothetical protein
LFEILQFSHLILIINLNQAVPCVISGFIWAFPVPGWMGQWRFLQVRSVTPTFHLLAILGASGTVKVSASLFRHTKLSPLDHPGVSGTVTVSVSLFGHTKLPPLGLSCGECDSEGFCKSVQTHFHFLAFPVVSVTVKVSVSLFRHTKL